MKFKSLKRGMRDFYVKKNQGASRTSNFFVIMRLTIMLVMAFCTQLVLAGYAQNVSVDFKKASLKQVISVLSEKSGYTFLYDQKYLHQASPVTVSAKDQPILSVVEKVFADQPFVFQVVDKVITIRPKPHELTKHVAQLVQNIEVSGIVTDSAGTILPGVSVVLKSKTSVGTTTDLNGRYILQVPPSAVLVFRMVGFVTQEIAIGGRTGINVVMQEDFQALEETVVTAFGQRAKKSDLVGSVTSISIKELQIPASNLTTALQGRVAGMVSFQRSGEPGLDNADFFIRGVGTFGVSQRPLILVDNMEVSTDDLARIPWDDLESFSVLRDATASAVYGSRGANGVIIVTTKMGQEGPAKINIRAEQRISAPTKNLEIADPVTFMTMNREAILTRNPLDRDNEGVYSLEKIDRTAAGDDPILYPAVDWLDYITKRVTTTQNYNLGISGGGQIATYNVSGNLTTDNGLLNIEPINNFNSNVRFNVSNLRTNVNVNVTKTTRLVARALVNVQDYNGPPLSGTAAYGAALRSNPVLFQPVYTPPASMSWITHPMFGNFGEGGYQNAYAEIVKGYSERRRSNLSFQTELYQGLSFFTEGLNFRGLLNITRNSYFEQSRTYNPFYYSPVVNLETGNVDNYMVINPEGGTEYLNFTPGTRDLEAITYAEAQLNYNRTFGNRHGVTGMLIGTIRDRVVTPDDYTLINTLPYRNVSFSGNATYAYDERYYAQFTFGYNGSERFANNYRWGFFPSFGLAWTVHKENFMESLAPTISNLRFRFTHGWVGNDNISDTRFFYLSEVNLNNSGRGYTFGLPTSATNGVSGVSISRYDNPYVQWEISRQSNLGIDLGLFNGALSFTGDFYRQYRYNIVQTRAGVPASAGLQAAVLANVGKYKSHGFDSELSYTKSVNTDLWFQGRGTFTYATGEYVFYDEPTYAYDYLSRVGLHANQTRGYIAERLFIDDAEVANSPSQQFGGEAVLGGDIKYVDVNNDGVVNSDDMVAIGHPTVPEITYGFGMSAGYKSFDLSFFFSGNARTSLFINPIYYNASTDTYGVAPFGSVYAPNAVLQAWADSYWSEENQNIYAQWPRLSQTPTANNTQTSTFWMRNGSFLRLKQAELGYNLKSETLKRYKVQNLRLYLSATNLFSFNSFKLWDPEMGGNGLAYPLQRVFNFGINVNL